MFYYLFFKEKIRPNALVQSNLLIFYASTISQNCTKVKSALSLNLRKNIFSCYSRYSSTGRNVSESTRKSRLAAAAKQKQWQFSKPRSICVGIPPIQGSHGCRPRTPGNSHCPNCMRIRKSLKKAKVNPDNPAAVEKHALKVRRSCNPHRKPV